MPRGYAGIPGLPFPVQDFHNIVAEIHRFRKQAKPFRRSPAYQSPFAGIHSASGTSITIPRTGFHLHKNQALPFPAHEVQFPAPDGTPIPP